MNAAQLSLFLLLPVLIVASGCCSASETALFSLRPADRGTIRRSAPRTAAAIATLLADPRGLLVTILLSNVTVNTTFFVVSAILAREVEGAGGAVFAVASLLVLILLGEVLPKLLAATSRIGFARFLGPPLLVVHRGLTPIREAVWRWAVAPLSRLLTPPQAGPRSLTVEELGVLLEHSSRRGAIDQDEQRLLADVISLGALRVRDVMRPRQDIDWLDERATPEELLRLLASTRRTLLPLCRGSLDDKVLGFLDAKSYLAARARVGPGMPEPALSAHLRPARFLPEQARLDRALEHFRASRSHVALCVNEFGGVVGLIAIEDIVAQFLDAAAPADSEAAEEVRQVAPGRWEVPGRLGVRDLAEYLEGRAVGALAGDSSVRTVAGIVLSRLGRIPSVGDSTVVGNLKFEVAAVSGRVIDRVAVSVEEAGA